MNKYIDCSKLGKIKESEFSELLLSQVGGTVQIPFMIILILYERIIIELLHLTSRAQKKIVELIILQIIISTE